MTLEAPKPDVSTAAKPSTSQEHGIEVVGCDRISKTVGCGYIEIGATGYTILCNMLYRTWTKHSRSMFVSFVVEVQIQHQGGKSTKEPTLYARRPPFKSP